MTVLDRLRQKISKCNCLSMEDLMNTLLATLLGAAAFIFCGGSVRAAYIESFDFNNASWLYGYGSNYSTIDNAMWSSSGGNPAGNISGAASNLYAIWTDTNGSVALYGEMTGLTMTIDTMVSGGAVTGTAQFYVGRAGSYYLSGTWSIGGDTDWTTHTAALNSTEFSAWSGASLTFAQVLQAPDDIGIFFGSSGAAGVGSVLVDNFGTVPTLPIPATAWLFGSGLLGLARISKRKP